MPRASKGAARTKARKRILRAARGYWGTRSRHKQQAKITLTAPEHTLGVTVASVVATCDVFGSPVSRPLAECEAPVTAGS